VKVLVIEEEQRVIRDISFCLKIRYPEVVVVPVAEGLKGIEMVETEAPDLVIASSSSANMEIPDLAARIREFSDVALIILSEGETEVDRAKGFEAGVDEYVTQPLSPIELLARVRALLRRTQGLGFKLERMVSFGGELIIESDSHEVLLSGKQVKLTRIEYDLLSELVRNEGRVLTHRSLIDKLWGPEYVTDLRFTKRYICQLRKKLNDNPEHPRMIYTERGVGYKFITPV
jgi:two-component system KDP operon response regulator KdpE